MIYDQELLNKVAVYVTKLFDKFQTPDLLYHNLQHTHRVVEHVNEIAGNYSLNDQVLFIINAAAWFHDTGHLFGPAAGHEEKSNLIMREFLTTEGIDPATIHLIESCISATRFPYEPDSLAAEILCDADSYHLGNKEFLVTDELVKEEFERRNISLPGNWDIKTLAMLELHHYFTSYCTSLLQDGKKRNIDIVRNKINGKDK